MPGLHLGVNGGVKWSDGNGFTSVVGPSTATEAGFGQGSTMPGTPNPLGAALAPNDPFGFAFWGGVASLGLLLFIRHSLPH